jgi:hypothetical protein
MKQPYKEFSPDTTKTVLEKLKKNNDGFGFDVNHTRIMACDLSFAKGWQILIAEDFSKAPFKSKMIIVERNSDPFWAKYSNNPYDDNNFDRMDIKLNDNNLYDYIAFYFKFFSKNGESLKPVLHFDEIEWQDDLPPMTRQSLEKDFQFYPDIKHEDNGNFILICPCVFQYSIMIVTFNITSDGKISISKRQSLMENLPIKNFS